ncbi:MAG: hypothetical protein IJW92_04475 [Clostridia bacterium]|nr:hypothetical protein [Clostridia bacterium]
MKKILEELWHGNLCPEIECRKSSKEEADLRKELAELHESLYATLNDEQKAILEKFDDRSAKLTDISEREIFIYSFRFGARFVTEVMRRDDLQ